MLKYSDENSISCVITLALHTRVEGEEKSWKGYTDFSFNPRRKNDINFIVEFKNDNTL